MLDVSILSLEDEKFVETTKKSEGELMVDVYQDDTHLYIVAPVAGVETEDLEISVNDNEVLMITGKRTVLTGIKESDFLIQECFWGAFSRSILLPKGLDLDSVKATFKRGVLTVSIAKLKIEKHKKIKIS